MIPTVAYKSDGISGYLPNPYLSEQDTALISALVKSVNAKVMIEFGCQEGRTSLALLQSVPTLERYYGIDVPADYSPKLEHQQSEIPNNAGHFAIHDRRFQLIISERGSFDLGLRDLPLCDAAFIDGDHSSEAVTHDSYLAARLVRSPGVIIWHDYGNSAVEVTEVLERLALHEHWPINVIKDTWLAFRIV